MTRRFAEDTRVPAAQTRSQIETMLRATKATRIITMDEALELVVGFVALSRWYKIVVPMPVDASQQARRAKWRALHLVIKAKLEAAEQGLSTLEDEFLASAVMPDGQRVRDWIEPQLERAYETGRMPPLLPDYSKGS